MKNLLIFFLAIPLLSTSRLRSQKIKTPTACIKREIDAEIHYMHTDQISAKKLQRETHYLAIYLTAENKIADMRGY